MRRPIIAVLAAAAVVFGLVWLGQFGRAWLEQRRHYSVKFADLHCDSPPGMDRTRFLAEVQYCGSFPDQINLLDPSLVNRVQAAFMLHPWVERVDSVNLRGPDGPTVALVIRKPVLVVAGRVVDRFGVLLPTGTPTDGLPTYPGEPPPPKGRDGLPWGDPDVEAAARKAGEQADSRK
jgi:hypothetical protein